MIYGQLIDCLSLHLSVCCHIISVWLFEQIRAQLMFCGYHHRSVSSSSMLIAVTARCWCFQIWILEFMILKQSQLQHSWWAFPLHIYDSMHFQQFTVLINQPVILCNVYITKSPLVASQPVLTYAWTTLQTEFKMFSTSCFHQASDSNTMGAYEGPVPDYLKIWSHSRLQNQKDITLVHLTVVQKVVIRHHFLLVLKIW